MHVLQSIAFDLFDANSGCNHIRLRKLHFCLPGGRHLLELSTEQRKFEIFPSRSSKCWQHFYSKLSVALNIGTVTLTRDHSGDKCICHVIMFVWFWYVYIRLALISHFPFGFTWKHQKQISRDSSQFPKFSIWYCGSWLWWMAIISNSFQLQTKT